MDADYAHIFDCDGVILDSNNFKIVSLIESLNKEDFSTEEIKKITNFFKLNFGLTRDNHFIKFREIIDQNESNYDAKYKKLRSSYDSLVLANYSKCFPIKENIDYMKKLAKKSDIYVVSASDEKELRSFLSKKINIIKEENIFGGPVKKNDNLRFLKNKLGEKLVYYGDSINDAKAAISNDIKFIGLSKYSNSRDDFINFCLENNLIILETL